MSDSYHDYNAVFAPYNRQFVNPNVIPPNQPISGFVSGIDKMLELQSEVKSLRKMLDDLTNRIQYLENQRTMTI